jgi:hypothetical protein
MIIDTAENSGELSPLRGEFPVTSLQFPVMDFSNGCEALGSGKP